MWLPGKIEIHVELVSGKLLLVASGLHLSRQTTELRRPLEASAQSSLAVAMQRRVHGSGHAKLVKSASARKAVQGTGCRRWRAHHFFIAEHQVRTSGRAESEVFVRAKMR